MSQTPIVSVEQLRAIQWHLNFRWAVKFKEAPSPFNTWFPATTLDENIVTLEKMDFVGGISSFSIPKNTTQFTINMTIVDGGLPDNNLLVIHDWMVDWSNEIIPSQGYVRTISEISKHLQVVKFDGKGRIFNTNNYMVFPDGQLNYQGSSDTDTANLDLSFVVSAILKQDLSTII